MSSNVEAFRDLTGVEVCAVVKADAYGHGAVEVARAAIRGGATLLAVALVSEGTGLRRAGIDAPVMLLSQASPGEMDELVAQRLEPTVYTHDGIRSLAAAVERAGGSAKSPVPVHLKVDTGMNRVGAAPDEVLDLARLIGAMPGLALASVFTHLAVADDPADERTAGQIEAYRAVLGELEAAGVAVSLRHAANTAAAVAHPDARFDMVRIGIGLYGLSPGPAVVAGCPTVPVMSLHARVAHVKTVPAGAAVSYGLRYELGRPSTIATVPLGYADGVPRALSANGGEVLIGGARRPIAGTVTMDQIMVDCGDDTVSVGDEVVLFGRQGDETVSVAEWARRVGTIDYEIVCGVSHRVPRRYRGEEPEL